MPAPRRTPPALFALFALLAGALLLPLDACIYPATEVIVVIDTDLDPAVPMTISASISAHPSGNPTRILGPWTRARAIVTPTDAGFDGAAPDSGPSSTVDAAGVTLPMSFAIIPGSTVARDGTVYLEVTADANGELLRRRASFAFIPRRTARLRVFLSALCAAPATGCTSSAPCTLRALCEEQGRTCGNEGRCIDVPVPLDALDGGFDAGPSRGCGEYGQYCCSRGAPCQDPLSCGPAGRCVRCTDPDELCCAGPDLRPDGTECAATMDPCHRPGVCMGGVCGVITNAPDGTVCAPTSDPCKRPGRCAGGACGAITDAPDGTMCAAAPNRCHSPARCSGGRCGAPAALADGTPWGAGGFNRCCGGQEVTLDTTANCNLCGNRCAAGQRCVYVGSIGAHFCSCNAANAQCPISHFCRTQTPNNNLCSCNVASDCPGGRCVQVSFNPNYCTY